ncbi:hypothetical protein [Paracoccus salipaludis]|uniref:hypothetical protein n=1 Tax=Paracoccus salipaludis TaxID=2032623 RepID=UPI0010715E0B|nr:hypothetical protein [Paracoccus salipaludis]
MSKRSAPEFALSFSNDAVHLMERTDPPAAASVRWKERAVAAFDAPDFRAEMAKLRKLVANGRDAKVALIIPDDQILYTSLPIPGDDHRPAELGEALDGLTPYPVADLAWDWRPSDAGDVRVAAVARQTLREAEDFARRHGFAAAGFLADPADGLFPATPRFGETAGTEEVLGEADLPGDLPADQAPVQPTDETPAAGALADAELEDAIEGAADRVSAVVPEGQADHSAVSGAHTSDEVAGEVGGGHASFAGEAQEGPSEAKADVAPEPMPSTDADAPGTRAEASAGSEESGAEAPVSAADEDSRAASGTDSAIAAPQGAEAPSAPAPLQPPAAAQVPEAGSSDPASPTPLRQSDMAAGRAARGRLAAGAAARQAAVSPQRTQDAGGADVSSEKPSLPDRGRVVIERAAAARALRVDPPAPMPVAQHPGARGGVGALLVMLCALLVGLMLIWAFATPGERPVAATPALPAGGTVPQPEAEGTMAPVPATSPDTEDRATAEDSQVMIPEPAAVQPDPVPVEAEDATLSSADEGAAAELQPETVPATSPAALPQAPAAAQTRPVETAPAAVDTPVAPAAATPQAPVVAGQAEDALSAADAAVSADNVSNSVAESAPAQAAAAPVPSATTAAGSAPVADAPSIPAPASVGDGASSAGEAQALAPAASARSPAEIEAAASSAAAPSSTPQTAAPSAQPAAPAAAIPERPVTAVRRSLPAAAADVPAAPAVSEADPLPAVVPGRRALTRSERPASRPASAQSSRAAAAPRAAAPARPSATAAPRPAPSRPEAAPRASARPAATREPVSSGRPVPRPEEGSADESVTAAEMTPAERVVADALLADLYALHPSLQRLSPAPAFHGPRLAEARPSRRPGAAPSAVDAAVAEAVASKPAAKSSGDRPASRAAKADEAKAAPAKAAPVKAAANTNGRPASRPARGGAASKPSSAVESAVAEAVATARPSPVTLASAASLAPVRKPTRPAATAPAPEADAQAEAVAAAAATALRAPVPTPVPDPAPVTQAAPTATASAAPVQDDSAQRMRDEQLQQQAEERARQRAASDAQAEMQARAAAEARARAQAEAEERAAIAARGSYRPPEIDDEPEIAQKPAEGRSGGDVAKNATLRGIETTKTQVIGVIGAGRASRGLIRLRNGKVVTVRLGDRIDGGAINSIGNGKITYVKGGRTYNLPILNGR